MAQSETTILAIVVGLHWGPLILAALFWPLREVRLSVKSVLTLLLSLLAWFVVVVCLFVITDLHPNGRAMTGFGAYLIYSMMTLGVLPVVVILVHAFAGRSAGLLLRSALRRGQVWNSQTVE